MIILGIDPGKAIGLCLYDTDARRVVVAESAEAATVNDALHRLLPAADATVIERPRVYGMGGNEMADTIEQCGWLIRRCGGMPVAATLDGAGGAFLCWGDRVYTCERRGALKALSDTIGSDVRKDAGVWAALLTLHGPDAERAPQEAIAGRPYLPRIQSVTATKTRAAVQGQREQTAIEAREAVPAGPLHGVRAHERAALAVAWSLGKVLGDKWLQSLPM